MAMQETPESDIILIPEILFQTEIITSSDGSSFETAELIRTDQPLIRLVTPAEAATPLPCALVRGEHTYLSQDNSILLSEVDGYPLLTKTTKKGVDNLMVSMVPFCAILSDKMLADITLLPAVTGCTDLNIELLLEILEDNEIRFGFSQKHLQKLLDQCKETRSKISREPIAQGMLPLDGKDSFLRFAIEVGPLPGKLLGDGSIDFRERKMFVGVAGGQTIATRIPATDGTPGLNVSGTPIEQTPGRNIAVTVSDDANYDEDSGVITASHGGILSLVNENSIKVCAKQVISGNIDYNTGNIESQDAVEISGTILPGFKVITHGDLLLGGNVRLATVVCHGNLVIKGGILGKQCRVKVQGDADFSFMEQGYLRAYGSVIIRKQAYFTKIMADGDICCEERSQIMAGELMCGGSITLGSVGSTNSAAALLAAGISPGRYLRYLSMRAKLQELTQELKLFLQRFGMKQKPEQRLALESSIDSLKGDMKKLNLIPAGSTDEGDDAKKYLSNISISVHGTMFSGTELQIGNSTKIIRRDRNNVRFSLDKYGRLFTETKL